MGLWRQAWARGKSAEQDASSSAQIDLWHGGNGFRFSILENIILGLRAWNDTVYCHLNEWNCRFLPCFEIASRAKKTES